MLHLIIRISFLAVLECMLNIKDSFLERNIDMGILSNEGGMKKAALKETFSWFAETSKELLIVLDSKGRVKYINASLEKALHYELSEVEGMNYLEFVHKNDRNKSNELLYVLQHNQFFLPYTNRYCRKDGTYITLLWHKAKVTKEGWIQAIAQPIDDNGTFIAVSGTTKDLTKRMKKTTMIQQQYDLIPSKERLLLDITENISDVITLFDRTEFKILYASPSIEQLWGISSEELCENPRVMKGKFYREDLKKMIKMLVSPSVTPRELEYKLKDESKTEERWIRTNIIPYADENGQITKSIGISRDITEWKKQDDALKKQEKLRALGQLAAGMAHEIRNPLTTVKGFIQLLDEESDNDFYNKIIFKEIEQIESIMKEYLMLANPYEEIKYAHHNINDVLIETIQFMRPEALLHKVEMNKALGDTLPFIYCEPKQIKQAIMNIFKNAIQAMPSGGNIYITTSLLPNGSVAVEVRDEGCGISKEMIDHLGEPFYSNKGSGTGLGLMVSYKIIENHCGTIQIESENGNGTNVRIILPSEQCDK